MAARTCSACKLDLLRAAYGNKQWKSGSGRRCKQCTQGGGASEVASDALRQQLTTAQRHALQMSVTLSTLEMSHERLQEKHAAVAASRGGVDDVGNRAIADLLAEKAAFHAERDAEREASAARHAALEEQVAVLREASRMGASSSGDAVEALRADLLRARVECDATKEELAAAEDRVDALSAAGRATTDEMTVLQRRLRSEASEMERALISLREREQAVSESALGPSAALIDEHVAALADARAELDGLKAAALQTHDETTAKVDLHQTLAAEHRSKARLALIALQASRAKRAGASPRAVCDRSFSLLFPAPSHSLCTPERACTPRTHLLLSLSLCLSVSLSLTHTLTAMKKRLAETLAENKELRAREPTGATVEDHHAAELLHNARMLERLRAQLDESETRCRDLEAAATSSRRADDAASPLPLLPGWSSSDKERGADAVEAMESMQRGLATLAQLKESQDSVGRLMAKLDAMLPQ